MKPRKPIFYDEQRRRWRRTSRVLEICGAIFTLLVVIFFISVLVSPSLPEPLLPTNRNELHPVYEKVRTRSHAEATRPAYAAWRRWARCRQRMIRCAPLFM